MDEIPLRDLISNAIRFWERGRILYNGTLALIFCYYFLAAWPASKSLVTLNAVLILFILAILANIAYCAAYIIDIFAQLSSLRLSWLRFRWVLFLVGLLFASIITRFFSMGIFLGVVE